MKAIAKVATVCFLLAALSACNLPQQKSTPTPTPGQGSVSSSIFSNVPTITARPMETSVQSSMTGLPMPSKVPYEYWKGIRIMSDAIAGDEITGGYYFAIDAPVEVIQAFYNSEMAGLDWLLTDIEQGTVGNKMLIYQKESESATISITPQDDGNVYVVLNV